MNLGEQYWNERYINHETGWDLSSVSPPIKAYIDQLETKDLAILIPGCGNAHEADYLLSKGFTNITIIDLSSILVEQLNEKYQQNPAIKIIHGNFFEHQGKYDLILEQTFFCAIEPSLRVNYAQHMQTLLNTKAKIVGVLFNCNFERQGPPFGGNKEAYWQLFDTNFNIRVMETAYNSIGPRQGN
ncbi:MAG: methyltransferase domain-containing protein, partial [Bacteroidia bacterium]|nr:methyltransferase domain-containing protein [Bacteroidia bacterium]